MSRAEPLTITLIEVDDLEDVRHAYYDPLLYPAFMLMSASLAEAASQRTGEGVERTSPLRFSFTERTFIFRKQPTQPGIATLLREQLFPGSDGVIVNLRDSIPSDNKTSALLMKEMLQAVYKWSGPTIFSTKRASLEVSNSGKTAESYFQPWPHVIQSIRENFPKVVPIIGYDYSRPGSVKRVLTTLLAEIDKMERDVQVRVEEPPPPEPEPLMTQFEWLALKLELGPELEPVIASIEANQKAESERLLKTLLRKKARSVPVWLLLATVLSEASQQRDCIERALRLKPDHWLARKMQTRLAKPEIPPPTEKDKME